MNRAGALIDVVRHYYEACNVGDLDEFGATLHPDVVHYFLAPNNGSAPVRSRRGLAEYWLKVQPRINGFWEIDHWIEADTEVAIEWSLFWTPTGQAGRVVTRGSEWFELTDGLISEIRSYYHQALSDSQLEAFPYVDRGYSALNP